MKAIIHWLKQKLLNLMPSEFTARYHWWLAQLAALAFNYPSRKMIVIGVTGTNGKSTTVMMIGKILEAAGYKVGWTSTAMFKVDKREWLNASKMTMLGRLKTQKLLWQMYRAGCEFAIVETSSQGITQFRHSAIEYDSVVFTNLTPEHIEAHGGFEQYKQAKGKLFQHLTNFKPKKIKGKIINKVSVVNLDDPNAGYFLDFPAQEKIGFTFNNDTELSAASLTGVRVVRAEDISLSAQGSKFEVDGCKFELKVLGKFNVANAVAAIAATRAYDVPLAVCHDALGKIEKLPGRVEFIDEGQSFIVLVDYAPEPESLRQLYETIDLIPHERLIHILGSAGGGRDTSRRPVLGRMAAQKADIVIVTNEDPYDEPPMKIIEEVATGARFYKTMHPEAPMQECFTIRERQKALEKAISLAQPGDLVLATGKGSEQAICVAHGKKLPWDERGEFRKILRNFKNSKVV